MRVASIVGARPQFVKAAMVSRVLRVAHTELLIHTGQHYDDAMSAAFFRDLEIPLPDVNLEVGSGSHGEQTAAMIAGLETVLLEQQPDGVLVYGDTNSTLAASVVASKISYPNGRRPWLAHVEAGLRSFNSAMPEERNRIVADHLSDLLFAPTPQAMQHLGHEGLAARAELVGDVMVDAFNWARSRPPASLPPEAASRPGYILATIHRAENVDDTQRLAGLLDALALERPVILPIHPRTRRALAALESRLPPNVTIIEPVGYLAMVALECAAAAIATDSGGVQKEAFLAGVPCLTLRTETEWTETVEAGWNRVVNNDADAVRTALDDPIFMDRTRPRPELFGDGQAATRIVAALERHADQVTEGIPA